MTIYTTSNIVSYDGNDVATSFDFDFKLLQSNDELIVTLIKIDGTSSVLVEDTDYTVSLNGSLPNNGSITYPVSGSPLATGERLIIQRIVPLTQEVDLENQGGYYPDTQEIALDKLTAGLQQLQEEVDRSFKISVGSTETVTADEYVSEIQGYVATATTQAGLANTARIGAESARDDILNDTGFIAVAADLTGDDNIGTVAADLTGDNNIGTCADNIAAIVAAPDEADRAEAAADSIDFADFSALTEETTPASGDLFVMERAGVKKAVDFDNIGGVETFIDLEDVDISSLTVGKTLQVVNVGGTPKIQQVKAPPPKLESIEITSNQTSTNPFKHYRSKPTAGDNINITIDVTNFGEGEFITVSNYSSSTGTTTLKSAGGSYFQLNGKRTQDDIVLEGYSFARITRPTGDSSYVFVELSTELESLTAGDGIDITDNEISLDIYTGSTIQNTSFPVGSYVALYTSFGSLKLNQSMTIYLQNTSDSNAYTNNGTGSALTGTWVLRGRITDTLGGIFQRIA